MGSIESLLNPKGIAIIGASEKRGTATHALLNLQEIGFKGEVYAVNPRYQDVHGYKCFASVAELPKSVDNIFVGVPAAAACDVLEQAFDAGIRAAVVPSAGFGEGGHFAARAERLRVLAAKGMSICGPNCYGIINLRTGVSLFSGQLPKPLLAGPVALVSQSGGLSSNAFMPLMSGRRLGFNYVVSCGNQIGTTIEDYIEYFLDDPEVRVIASIVESITRPDKLADVARRARAVGKPIVFFQTGRSAAGQIAVRSHTGALAGNSQIFAAFLRRCGIIQVPSLAEFVETIELFAHTRFDPRLADDVVTISGSGGGAAAAADALNDAGIDLAAFDETTKQRIEAALPAFGSVMNPVDATGVIYSDPAMLKSLFGAILDAPVRSIVAVALPVALGQLRRFAKEIAEVASASDRTIVAYHPNGLGGEVDPETLAPLHAAGVPVLLGISVAMKVLKYLSQRRDYLNRPTTAVVELPKRSAKDTREHASSFIAMRERLVAAGVEVVDAALATSAEEAVTLMQRFGGPVAVKAEARDLLHKSDLDCVRLGCSGESDVAAAFRTVVDNARRAGCASIEGALIQPMVKGVTEAYAGVIVDPVFGPAICFGLGGIFVEVLSDIVTEMAPLSQADALAMIRAIRGIKLLEGARGRPHGDIEALADFLVSLSHFAVANFGSFRAIDLNPVMVMPEGGGVTAVDIAVELFETDVPTQASVTAR